MDDFEEAGKRLLGNPKEVYLDDISIVDSSLESYPCKIIRADQTYFHRSMALALKTNSPYEKILNYKISRYKEQGVLANMGAFKKIRKEDINCLSDHFESVGYETIFSAFVILGFGLICSFFYVLVEFQLHFFKIEN